MKKLIATLLLVLTATHSYAEAPTDTSLLLDEIADMKLNLTDMEVEEQVLRDMLKALIKKKSQAKILLYMYRAELTDIMLTTDTDVTQQ